MLKDGLYEVMGNTVEVENGVAFDLDAREEIPEDVVLVMGTYLGKATEPGESAE